jgi:hypothetical protein
VYEDPEDTFNLFYNEGTRISKSTKANFVEFFYACKVQYCHISKASEKGAIRTLANLGAAAFKAFIESTPYMSNGEDSENDEFIAEQSEGACVDDLLGLNFEDPDFPTTGTTEGAEQVCAAMTESSGDDPVMESGHGEAIAPQSTVVSSEMKLRSGDGMVAKRSLEGVANTSAGGEALSPIVEPIAEGISVTPSKGAKRPKVKHF